MRILVSTGIFPNELDPTRGIYIYKQVEALARRCEVEVIAPVAQYPPGLRGGLRVPAESVIEGMRIRHPRYPIVPRVRVLHGPAIAWATRDMHRRVAQQLHPDVILSFFAYPYGYAAAAIGRRLGVPVIIGTLGSDVNVKARRILERPMIRWAFARAARILSVSRALDEAVGKMGVDAARRVVIPNGIDGRRFVPMDRRAARESLGLSGDGRLVCCVSRLSHEKGIDVLLNAVSTMETQARVIVVGDGVERAALARLAGELGVSDRVDFVGSKPHAEVPTWIAAADVAVLPSRMEGHPNAVVEAMACGRPVVAARVGGVPDTIRGDEMGLMVDPDDPGGLARALDVALARTWDEGAIAAAGGVRTWDHVASEIMQVISEVGSERS